MVIRCSETEACLEPERYDANYDPHTFSDKMGPAFGVHLPPSRPDQGQHQTYANPRLYSVREEQSVTQSWTAQPVITISTPGRDNSSLSGQNGSNSDSDSDGSKPTASIFNYSSRQIFVLLVVAYGNFWVAGCVSLQAPFFPAEAEAKGMTSTVYGLVFGVYELVIVAMSPVFGKLIAHIRPNFLVEGGLFLVGGSTVLFGIIDQLPDGIYFTTFAFVIRIFEGMGAAAFMTASYSIMAAEFPDCVGTAFSFLGTSFGFGLIIGPTVGGALYEFGGYLIPFVVLGSFLLLGSFVAMGVMPASGDASTKKSGHLVKFLADAGVTLDALSILTSLLFIGFNAATLEPHLRQFDISPMWTGFIFIITGSIYAVTAPIWGRFFDAGVNPKLFIALGCLLDAIGFVVIGPLPFLPMETHLWMVITALVFVGVGTSAKLVAAFVDALNDAVNRRGFANDMSTYGLVSAMYFSSNSIGAFVGPTLGGFLLEEVGYRKASVMLFVMDVLLMFFMIMYLLMTKIDKSAASILENGKNHGGESQTLLDERRQRRRYDSMPNPLITSSLKGSK